MPGAGGLALDARAERPQPTCMCETESHEVGKGPRGRMVRLLPTLVPAAAVVLALIPAAVGITWGLPSEERFARVAGDRREEIAREIVARTRSDEPRKRAGLTFEALDPDEPDEAGRLYRRFALYSDHPDEMLVLSALSRMRPSALDFDPGAYHYGGLFVYPIGVLVRVAGWLGIVPVSRDLGVYLERPERFGRMYLAGRLYVLAWHAGGLVALFLLARSVFGARAGYLAVAVYALLPATVAFSHEMKPHVPGATLAILVALALRKIDGMRGTLAAGALGGAAASMAPPYAVALLLLPAHAWSRDELRGPQKMTAWKRIAAGAGAAFLVYAVLNPYVVLRPGRFLAEMRYGAAMYPTSWRVLAPVSFLRYFPDALTLPGTLLAAGAVAWLVWKRRAEAKALGAPLGVVFALVSFSTAGSPTGATSARFGCLLYPFLALFMAGAIDEISSRGGRARIAGIALASVLALSLVLGSVPYLVAYASNARGGGTRIEAGRGIESRVEAGSTIGTYSRLAPYRTPTFEIGRYRCAGQDLDPGELPDWFLTVGREAPPSGYVLDERFEPFGIWPVFGSPERMSFASPVFALWRRER